MSKYEWERGTLVLPVAEYRKVRDALINHHNTTMDANLLIALEIYEKAKVKLREKRGQLHLHVVSNLVSLYQNSCDYELVEESLLTLNERGCYSNKSKLKKPIKKAFPKANKSTLKFEAGYDGEITLNPANHSITWEVSENNHAVENARESEVGSLLFNLLRNVKWTSRTGGVIVGNDEYNQENDTIGGGANYVTAQFGGIGKREVQHSY